MPSSHTACCANAVMAAGWPAAASTAARHWSGVRAAHTWPPPAGPGRPDLGGAAPDATLEAQPGAEAGHHALDRCRSRVGPPGDDGAHARPVGVLLQRGRGGAPAPRRRPAGRRGPAHVR